jgi:ABC-type transport system substrate-binding protein
MYLAPGTNLHLLPGTLFQLSSPLKPVGNNSNFTDDTYKQLVAATGSETDQTKLKQVYSQLNDIILDQSFVMYLSPIPLVMVALKNVHDVTPNMHDGAWLETNTWLG